VAEHLLFKLVVGNGTPEPNWRYGD